MHTSLAAFNPLIARWFSQRYALPTDAQVKSWPLIAKGEHALITAPTGSGKTLTAFLWAINQFCEGALDTGQTGVLYVSPLKALNTDIRRNLTEPLDELRSLFAAEGRNFPHLRVETRSGDTPSEERVRMLRKPPEILITTPESLNLLLSTSGGRHALRHVRSVILDEVHALIDSRRGTHLITAVERLTLEAGEFQRIALSATVNPLPTIAAWVAGYRVTNPGIAATYQARPIHIVRAKDEKRIDLRIEAPTDAKAGDDYWQPVAERLRALTATNRSTLTFVNSRRMAERITSKVNEGQVSPQAYAHHGSLSREIRSEVERRMKAGELKTIIATSSLEMGIDIGELDEVVMVQSPPSVAGTLQRIGRAGHQVGATSRALLMPTFGHDLVAAATLSQCVEERDLEPTQPLVGPLDLLAQILVSMCIQRHWEVDQLYSTLRGAAPFHALERAHFDLVLQMLTGRYAASRIRSLQAKLSLDALTNIVTARKGAAMSLYLAGGTIPDRGYYTLRHAETNAAIGELDEEFVWEARVGQLFSLGTQTWRIHQITHNDVFVKPNRTSALAPPFWRAEGMQRNHHLSLRIADNLERFEQCINQRGGLERLRRELREQHRFDDEAASRLLEFLSSQREYTQAPLPHRHHLLIEHVNAGPSGYASPDRDRQIVLHTLWGARVNRPFGVALAAAWENRFGEAPELHIADDIIVLQLKEDRPATQFLDLVDLANLEKLLRSSLESSAFFGARFRECAGRALLLAPRRFNQRQPLWMTRLQAKQLMAEVANKPDFPILLEAWRTCLQDEFDLQALQQRLPELQDGSIAISEVYTAAPSPFAGQITFDQINRYMYADDTPSIGERTQLSDGLLNSLSRNNLLRPAIEATIIEEYEFRRHRLATGYAPSDVQELIEWVKERVWLTQAEWRDLITAIEAEDGGPWLADERLAAKLLRLNINHATIICAQEDAAVLIEQLFADANALHLLRDEAVDIPKHSQERHATQLLAEVGAFYGPKSLAAWQQFLPLPGSRLEPLIEQLVNDEHWISGALIKDDVNTAFCDVASFESLLRLQRARHQGRQRSNFVARPITQLPAFLAAWQGFGAQDIETAAIALEGYTAAATHFESFLLPARLAGYQPHQLDSLLRAKDWFWQGAGRGKLRLLSPATDDLMEPRRAPDANAAIKVFPNLGEGSSGRFSFFELAEIARRQHNLSTSVFSEELWRAVWAGVITADDFAPIRAGHARDYSLPDTQDNSAIVSTHASARLLQSKRAARERAQGWPGHWRLLAPPSAMDNPLDEFEHLKDRVRILLTRYGVLSRELIAHESAPFTFKGLFRAMRLMEFAGELVAGQFFEGLSGPQFIEPAALRRLEMGTHDGIFAIGALDPISPCGMDINWPTDLPRRAAGNDLVFHGDQLVVTSLSRGKHLQVQVEPTHPHLSSYWEALANILRYATLIEVETINKVSALQSPYLPTLGLVFALTHDHRRLTLQTRTG